MSKGSVVFAWLPSPIGGIPCLQQDFFDSVFSFCVEDAKRTDEAVWGGYCTARTGYIAQGRNMLIEQFLAKSESDWLLMVDWDVIFRPEDVYRLLETADPLERPIVSGCYVTYFGGDNLLRPCWMRFDDSSDEFRAVPVEEFSAGEVVKLSVVGMGFTLMHRDALEKIAKANPVDPWKWFGHDVINGERVGEDVTFCYRAWQVGLPVYGDGGVMLGHYKSKTLEARDMLNPAFAKSLMGRVNKKVLNVGAGGSPMTDPVFEGWEEVRLDLNPEFNPDICMDARELRSYAPAFAEYDAVLLSHVLEHFTDEDVPTVLTGCMMALRPGGKAYIRVPDMGAVQDHIDNGGDWDDIAYTAPVGPIRYRDMRDGYFEGDFMEHKTGFTSDKLLVSLEDAGFVDIEITNINMELQAIAKNPGSDA